MVLTPLIWEHVNPYGRFELDMNAQLPLQLSNWHLVTRVLGLPHVIDDSRLRLGGLKLTPVHVDLAATDREA